MKTFKLFILYSDNCFNSMIDDQLEKCAWYFTVHVIYITLVLKFM